MAHLLRLLCRGLEADPLAFIRKTALLYLQVFTPMEEKSESQSSGFFHVLKEADIEPPTMGLLKSEQTPSAVIEEAYMLEITPAADGTKRMSSQDIATLTDSRHDNVLRTIERLVSRMVMGLPPMEEKYGGSGRPSRVYMLEERESYIVVARLSPEFTAALVDRWRHLETQQSKQTLETHPKYSAKWVCRTAVSRSITPTIKQTLALFEQRYPQSVRRQREDFLLAPFLAYELAEQLIYKAELNYEQREKREEATEKQWQKLCEGKEEIRAFFKQDPDVAMLTRRLTDEQLLERFNQE